MQGQVCEWVWSLGRPQDGQGLVGIVLLNHSQFDLKLSISFIWVMASSRQDLSVEEGAQKPPLTSETIFKYVNIFVTLILVFCIQGFLNFRDHCISKGIYVFSIDSFIWSLVGFIGIFIAKYSWFYLMSSKVESIVHSKYEGEERAHKHRSIMKLSFDSIFYTFVTALAYILFRNDYWFPSMVGGCGSCSMIYKDYPNWPAASSSKLQMYFMIQLGIHIFSLFEMVIIKRKTQRKFYELTLHHSVAASLILFSTMSNQIVPGAMILIVHDASDILMAFARFFVETIYPSNRVNTIIYIMMTLVWIWMRIIVFPFCLLANVYMNRPTPQDDWKMISFEYDYLLVMAFVLYGMHLFWTFLIIKIGIKSTGNKGFENVHDKKIKQ